MFDNLGNWFDKLTKSVELVKSSIINLTDSITDSLTNAFTDILTFLFVPTDNAFNSLVDLMYEKFGFVNQVIDIIDEIKNVQFSDKLPSFTVTLYGKKYTFIDLSMYEEYRLFIHDIIVAISYFFYFIWLLSEIPAIIGGITSGQYTVHRTNMYHDYLDSHNIPY